MRQITITLNEEQLNIIEESLQETIEQARQLRNLYHIPELTRILLKQIQISNQTLNAIMRAIGDLEPKKDYSHE